MTSSAGFQAAFSANSSSEVDDSAATHLGAVEVGLSFWGISHRTVEDVELGPDWDQKANSLLRKHFGYSGLKSFQMEALGAWFSQQDCLVLAATWSGKSLCFQLPALLTRKVVVVISPLISLMHDQCLKLSKHGISACFLGSGQPDNTVEKKAMNGMYSVVYVCLETLLR
ncbi:hypothetical protein SOVF_178950 [Spinacia oleracea]|nr:hypothetical protein SOVF_178950 [Spinacia oleracea]